MNEATQISGLGRTTLYELLNAGKLDSVTIGRRRLILLASIEKLLGMAMQHAA